MSSLPAGVLRPPFAATALLHFAVLLLLLFQLVPVVEQTAPARPQRQQKAFAAYAIPQRSLDEIADRPCDALDLTSTFNKKDSPYTELRTLARQNQAQGGNLEETRVRMAHFFCKTMFPDAFTKPDWRQARQTVIKLKPSDTRYETNADATECLALKLMAGDWTLNLLLRRGAARMRWERQWEQWRRQQRFPEMLFHCCAAALANDDDAFHIQWAETILQNRQGPCPLLLKTNDSTMDALQKVLSETNDVHRRFTTKQKAEQHRRKAAFVFCRALFPDEQKWAEVNSEYKEPWYLADMDVARVPECPAGALLQPEVRAMLNTWTTDANLKQQLVFYLGTDDHTTDKRDVEQCKGATRELCASTFGKGHNNTLLIVLCSVAGAVLLCAVALLALYCCWWRRRRRRRSVAQKLKARKSTGGSKDSAQTDDVTRAADAGLLGDTVGSGGGTDSARTVPAQGGGTMDADAESLPDSALTVPGTTAPQEGSGMEQDPTITSAFVAETEALIQPHPSAETPTAMLAPPPMEHQKEKGAQSKMAEKTKSAGGKSPTTKSSSKSDAEEPQRGGGGDAAPRTEDDNGQYERLATVSFTVKSTKGDTT